MRTGSRAYDRAGGKPLLLGMREKLDEARKRRNLDNTGELCHETGGN